MPTLFEPNKKYAVSFEKELTDAGRNEIWRLIRDECGYLIGYDEFGGMELVNKHGKIAKRIKNSLYKNAGLKLPGHVISQIGNIANNYSLDHGQYIIWADTNMDVWDHRYRDDIHINGGNRGSCFRDGGEYHHCWEAMDDHEDYYALLLAEGDGNGEMEGPAYARCWLQDNGNLLVLFNSYGEQLTRMSLIFAKALGLETQRGYLVHNHGMYVNDDRVNVILEKRIEEKPRVSILCDPDSYNDNYQRCNGCNCEIEIDWDTYANIDGEYYCEDCYSICEECNLCYVVDDIEYSEFSHRYLCERCEERDYLECTTCGHHITEDEEGTSLHNRTINYTYLHYCADCAGQCVVCNAALRRGQTRCNEHMTVQPELISVAVGD